MRKIILILLTATLISSTANAQINTLPIKEKPPKVEEKYDSLKNINYDNIKYLKGQTLFYIGSEPPTHDISGAFAPNDNVFIGKYFDIVDITGDHYSSYSLKLLDKVTTDTLICLVWNTDRISNMWVVVGHFEKLKSIYVGKEFMLVKNDNDQIAYADNQGLFKLETRTPEYNLPLNTIWKCIDISIDSDLSRENRYNNDDKTSRVILIFENKESGKYYSYYEVKFQGPLGDKFLSIDEFNIAQSKSAERKAALIKRYGATYGPLIFERKVRVGMSTSACKAAWGEPKTINKTTGSHGVTEQWVYSSGSYLYFENGKLTTIQN